jgi:hypothetical protein
MDRVGGAELMGIVDRLLCLLVAWLKGNSVVQTLFTCLYLHDVDAVADPVLRPFCTAVLKVCGNQRP